MRRNVIESAFLSQRHKKTSTGVLVEWGLIILGLSLHPYKIPKHTKVTRSTIFLCTIG